MQGGLWAGFIPSSVSIVSTYYLLQPPELTRHSWEILALCVASNEAVGTFCSSAGPGSLLVPCTNQLRTNLLFDSWRWSRCYATVSVTFVLALRSRHQQPHRSPCFWSLLSFFSFFSHCFITSLTLNGHLCSLVFSGLINPSPNNPAPYSSKYTRKQCIPLAHPISGATLELGSSMGCWL